MKVFLTVVLVALIVLSAFADAEGLVGKKPKRILRNPKLHPTLQVELNEPTICDPTVQQYSGYVDVGIGKHYFYWFFESKSNPSTDEFILWLNGGPGCSSLLGMLGEKIGPCEIASDLTEIPNPYSWTNNASVIFIDAPNGAGFSHGANFAMNTEDYAEDLYGFLQVFFDEFPQYLNLGFHIFGESYAGHYIPATAARIARGGPIGVKINLKSVGIGNGMTDPLTQYPFYSQMACNNSYGIQIFRDGVCALMDATTPLCTLLIRRCYATGDRAACLNATIFCNLFNIVPYKFTDINPYDVREDCEFPPLCYDFSSIEVYLNSDSVQEALGAEKRWKDCSYLVNLIFQLVGADWMKTVREHVIYLLDTANIPVLFYAGDADFIVNWYGIENMAHELSWSGQQGFRNTPYREWTPNGDKGGETKSYGLLTFLRVYEAGHMVPLDQPAWTTVMVQNWIHNRPL
jgi:cathepsin A (carboxypeptidase C)